MRSTRIVLALIALFLGAATAHAQNENRVGLGLGISPSGVEPGLDLAPAAIFVPIDFGSLRLEPEFGFARYSQDAGVVEQSSTAFQIGTGLFVMRPRGSTAIYYGGRLGFVRQTDRTDFPGGEEEESSTNLFLGPALGAEHAFSDRFSLGGEAQILFTSFGEEEQGEDSDTSLIRTRTVFFVRWYLN